MHPGCTKKDIARAVGYEESWVNKVLYKEAKRNGTRLYNEGSGLPKWYYRVDTCVDNKTIQVQPNKKEFIHDQYTRSVMSRIDSGKNVYVTGKAGTGKTRLLEEICRQNDLKPKSLKKVIVVLAPTGVAAEHIKESASIDAYTIHSFFKLPITPYVAKHKNEDLFNLKTKEIESLRELDMLIIDEISMVRCDLLDAVDAVLRHYRNSKKPFGGVQIAMFGDLYQLMPVAKQDEWSKISEYYETCYFFSSHVLSEIDYYYCELMKSYRQDENSRFVKVLNAIREAKMTLEDLDIINSRVIKKATYSNEAVILMTRNHKVNDYNSKRLSDIKRTSKTYTASYSRSWRGKFPVELSLTLKEGAKVMFVKNDTINEAYRNGTIGYVEHLGSNEVRVRIEKTGDSITVRKQMWEQYDFEIDKKERRIITKVTATFEQIPIKLAWAVTVHKSQGLTLNKVELDIADSFTYGQIYVALSRCPTLEGITLHERIPSHKIMIDDKIVDFRNAVGQDGKIGTLPSYKYYGADVNSFNTISLPLTLKRRDDLTLLKKGVKTLYDRTISDEKIAREVFVYNGNRIKLNHLYENRQIRTWKFDDNVNGDCPFEIRKCKYAKIYLRDYSDYALFRLNESIQVEWGGSSENWRCKLSLGKYLDRKTIREGFNIINNRIDAIIELMKSSLEGSISNQ